MTDSNKSKNIGDSNKAGDMNDSGKIKNADKEDTRNLIDEYKGLKNEEVFDRLAKKRNSLEVAIENLEHDFNIGTVVRNANNFNVSRVSIIGRKKYNRRGAMCTDKYLEIRHYQTIFEFLKEQSGRELVAIENNVPAKVLTQVYGDDNGVKNDRKGQLQSRSKIKSLMDKKFSEKTTLVFGSENEGISKELLQECDDIREIPNYGSTRSVNVGVASGIAMYEWVRQRVKSEIAFEGDFTADDREVLDRLRQR